MTAVGRGRRMATAVWLIVTLIGAPSFSAEPPVVEGPIQYVGPDTYILIDADGRQQPVLGMKYEEFVATWKKMQDVEQGEQQPRYAIEELRIEGASRGNHAEAVAEVFIRQLCEERLQVPLGMAKAILRDRPQWSRGNGADAAADGAVAPFVEFDAVRGGFVANISGRVGDVHRITMPMWIPLAHDGNETTLQLNCPRAAVAKLTFDVPSRVIEAIARDGSILEQSPLADGSTRFAAGGMAGDFRLTWTTPEIQHGELGSVLSATGAIAVSIDGHSIRSDARLTVASYGGGFDRFRVRLPPGAQLIQNRPGEPAIHSTKYHIGLEVDENSAAVDRPVVLVELAESQTGPLEISLSTEQPLGLPGEEAAAELAGFEVLGAVRQFGGVAIQVADDWQVRWQLGPYVRQVEHTDLAQPLQTKRPSAAFQYDRQPWSLRARVMPRPLRVHVVPEYQLELEPKEARLQARLAYQVPGARAFEFRIRLNGWELTPDAIESNGLVDRNGVVVTREGVLVLPLAQASSRRADVSFWLRRDLAPDATRVELPLPVPEVDSITPAGLTVSSSSSLELVPNVAGARGISPTPITDAEPTPGVRGGQPVYRFRAFLPDAIFTADRTFRDRDVAAEVATEIKLDRRAIDATQTIDYSVRYQPLDALVFEVPAGWTIDDGQIEVFGDSICQENALPAESVLVPIASELAAEVGESHRVEIPLPRPRMGRFGVRVRYLTTLPEEAPMIGRLELPLPQPAETRIESQRARISSPDGLAAALDADAKSSPWNVAGKEAGRNVARPQVEFVASGLQTSLPLLIQPIAREVMQPTVVDRVWLQTWQAGGTIQDRAAFRFRTAATIATVELPPAITADTVEVLVDGELADVAARERGRIVVRLPPSDTADAPYTLELRYRRLATVGILNREVFTPPQLVGSSALHETYWHIVLPSDIHVVQPPRHLVPVARWQWVQNFWGMQPTRTQAELEQWVGAVSQSAPAEAQSQYLYSGFAPLASIEVVTAPRWSIVFAASAAVLSAVLVWMYVPVVRRPWVGLIFALVVAALAIAYPTPALLLAQASLFGWIVATIAILLRAWLGESTVRQTATHSGSTHLHIRSLSRPESLATPALPAASGTPTAPLATPELER